MENVQLLALGQVGYQFQFKELKWLIDPYLSNYVEKKYGKDLKRLTPPPINPESIENVDFILITHEHEDHCDPITLEKILINNPNCIVFCTKQCNDIIGHLGATIKNLRLGEIVRFGEVSIKALPACHTTLEIDSGDYSRWMGYEFLISNYRIYHAGDTIPFDEIKTYLGGQVDLAFFPINERNYFRDSLGIIGNMTCREALTWIDHLKIKSWIPTHWDLFANNSTMKIELDTISTVLGINKHTWLDAGEMLDIKID